MTPLEDRLKEIVRASPNLMQVLTVARDLDLPDWLVFSGAVYQPVWNHLTNRPVGYGIRDYDLGYFDPDTSWDAEDAVIRRVAAAFDGPLGQQVEVRNQARVHLWFEDHFGEPYSPLASTAEALERFAAPACAVGVRLGDNDLTILAPFGLDDVFAMHLRPNPRRKPKGLEKVIANARARWPELTAVTDVAG
jgi:hypothetical protein